MTLGNSYGCWCRIVSTQSGHSAPIQVGPSKINQPDRRRRGSKTPSGLETDQNCATGNQGQLPVHTTPISSMCGTFSTLFCFMFFRPFLAAASEWIISLIFRQFSDCWMSRVIKHNTTQLVWWVGFFTLFKLCSVLYHFWNFFHIFFSH